MPTVKPMTPMSNNLPKVIFGTSCLGNLYQVMDEQIKQQLVEQCFEHMGRPVVFDSAGKYGAGLALESLGKSLKNAGVDPKDVIISNKLGWVQTPLTTPEPTFEPGVWKDLKNDAVQRISYDGIMECYHQGNELLGDYHSALVSVHDPDEYLAAAIDEQDEARRYADILEAYRALFDLKQQGLAQSVGIGAKNWRVIERIAKDVKLDWVMVANSMTIHSHPKELIAFMQQLQTQNIAVINSAVFNGGFLTGSNFYNYRQLDPVADKALYDWRDKFYAICAEFSIKPAEAAVAFAQKIPGVTSIALSTTKPQNVATNVNMAKAVLPNAFWERLVGEVLVDEDVLKYLLK